jgi:hypothetical protein
VHSFATLLADLATICLNTIAPADPALPGFRLVTTPPRSSGAPSTCSASATTSASRSQQPAPHITTAQVNGHPRRSLGELRFSLDPALSFASAYSAGRGRMWVELPALLHGIGSTARSHVFTNVNS